MNNSLPEIWKDVTGFEGLYQFSNLNNLKRISGSPNCKTDKFLKSRIDNNGYVRFLLSKNNKVYKKYVHHLIMEYLDIQKPNIKSQIRHLNGIKYDNNPSNLKWGTQSENEQDKKLHGKFNHYNVKLHTKQILNKYQVRIIKQLFKFKDFKIKDIAKLFNVSIQIIKNIKYNRTWRNIINVS
jgi:hypothetical protein